jgi:hypothetical protein
MGDKGCPSFVESLFPLFISDNLRLVVLVVAIINGIK